MVQRHGARTGPGLPARRRAEPAGLGIAGACHITGGRKGVSVKISIGSDHGGFKLKEAIKAHLLEKGHEVTDVGASDETSVDYPVFGRKAAALVADGTCERGIVVCSTGIGISISANKVRGIRCALCTDVFTARLTRDHNNSNMLALGQYVTGEALALAITDTWLETPFSGGERHQRRIDGIASIEGGESNQP